MFSSYSTRRHGNCARGKGQKAAHKRLNPTAANVPRLSLMAVVMAGTAAVSLAAVRMHGPGRGILRTPEIAGQRLSRDGSFRVTAARGAVAGAPRRRRSPELRSSCADGALQLADARCSLDRAISRVWVCPEILGFTLSISSSPSCALWATGLELAAPSGPYCSAPALSAHHSSPAPSIRAGPGGLRPLAAALCG